MSETVYVVVLNFNGWADTLECLESVLRFGRRADVEFGVGVIREFNRYLQSDALGLRTTFSIVPSLTTRTPR